MDADIIFNQTEYMDVKNHAIMVSPTFLLLTYNIRIMFMNYRVKKIAKTKFMHMKKSCLFSQIFLLNSFFVSFCSSIDCYFFYMTPLLMENFVCS